MLVAPTSKAGVGKGGALAFGSVINSWWFRRLWCVQGEALHSNVKFVSAAMWGALWSCKTQQKYNNF